MPKQTAQIKTNAAAVYGEKEKTEKSAEEMISRALDLQKEMEPLQKLIEPLKKELDIYKAKFKELMTDDASTQRLATNVGTVILKTNRSFSLFPQFVDKIKKLFGQTYKSFINEKMDFGCTAAFKQLLADGDYEHKDLIREATEIKINKSVEFEPPKVNKPKLAK